MEHFWTVEWDLTGQPPGRLAGDLLPGHAPDRGVGRRPARFGTASPLPATIVHGVVSRVFEVRLTGRGEVVGARFTPGGFAAWTGLDASAYTDRALPAVEVLGAGAGSTARTDRRGRVVGAAGRPAARDPAGAPAGNEEGERRDLAALVQRMATDDTLVRVEQLAELTGRSVRTLQRQFRRGVGVGPKWVLARYRLQEAAYALETDPGVDLADLAARLGWYDQAHLTNDFRKMLGETPGPVRVAAPVADDGRRRPEAAGRRRSGTSAYACRMNRRVAAPLPRWRSAWPVVRRRPTDPTSSSSRDCRRPPGRSDHCEPAATPSAVTYRMPLALIVHATRPVRDVSATRLAESSPAVATAGPTSASAVAGCGCSPPTTGRSSRCWTRSGTATVCWASCLPTRSTRPFGC